MGFSYVYYDLFLLLLYSHSLLLFHMGLLVQDTVPPKLILYGLPTGCSSPSTAPIQLCNTGLVLQELIHTGPHGLRSLSPPAPQWSLHELLLQPGATPAGVSMGVPPSCLILCCPMGSSMVAHGDLLCVVHMGCRCTASTPGGSPAFLLHLSCLQGYFSVHFSHFTFQLLLHIIFSLS